MQDQRNLPELPDITKGSMQPNLMDKLLWHLLMKPDNGLQNTHIPNYFFTYDVHIIIIYTIFY